MLTRVTKAETALQTQWMVLAYDDDVSIQYFGQNLSGWWKRKGMTGEQMVLQGIADFEAVRARCEKFDTELVSDLKAVGGEKYALLCSLAYRQSLAASKLVADPKGQPLFWPKENTSNGCIGTSDVIYPMSPITLLFGPALSKALVTPIQAVKAPAGLQANVTKALAAGQKVNTIITGLIAKLDKGGDPETVINEAGPTMDKATKASDPFWKAAGLTSCVA